MNTATMLQPDDTISSVLRYPGGKQRAAKRLVGYIPAGTKKVYSPFFGGGSVEFEWLSQNPGGKVVARDVFEPLVNFWSLVFKGHGAEIANRARAYLPITKEEFAQLQLNLRSDRGTPIERATWFFVVNRASFSGATLRGGMSSGARFTESACARLEAFDSKGRVCIRAGDVFDSIRRRSFTVDTCIYLDPPYPGKGKKLYGKEEFDHARLAKILTDLDEQGVKWLMSYNDVPEIHDLYKKFWRVQAHWKYGMSSDKDGRELIILSRRLLDCYEADLSDWIAGRAENKPSVSRSRMR